MGKGYSYYYRNCYKTDSQALDYDYRWVDANGIASEHFGEVTTSETVNKMSFTPSVNDAGKL